MLNVRGLADTSVCLQRLQLTANHARILRRAQNPQLPRHPAPPGTLQSAFWGKPLARLGLSPRKVLRVKCAA